MTPQPKPGDLEARLREHYHAKAGELRLPDIALDDVMARGDAPVVAAESAAPRRRSWIAGSVAAALVSGAVVGAGVVLVTRDDDRPSTGPSDLPQTELPQPQPLEESAATNPWCTNAEIPSDVADLGLVDDIRVPGIVLPAQTPTDHCATEHSVSTFPTLGFYTVWWNCADCNQPSAAVARLHTELPQYVEGDLPHDSVSVGGREGRWYEPSADVPVARLYVETGDGETATFAGWGMGRDEFIELAAVAVDQHFEEPADVGDMTMVYSGPLGEYGAGSLPISATLNVSYFSDGDTWLGYSVVQSETTAEPFTPPLEAYSWARPNATIVTVEGRRALTFPASAWFADREQTAVIVQIDDATQVVWTSTAEEPVAPEQLLAIPLTPASADDPRWLELAYESGNYDAQG